jgi:serine/threonine protein kinase
LFSTACTLWEALAGRRLFDAKTDPEVFAQLKACEVPPLAEIRSDLPVALVETIQRALSADPAARFPSARAMVHEFSEIMRLDDSWGDADVIVGNAVADARTARQQLAAQT